MNAPESQTQRIAYWDNAKAILIFFVVLGHFLLPVHTDRGRFVSTVYTWIYLFHMPAFVFVSGFFVKNYVRNGANDVRKPIGYFILYILYSLPTWASALLHNETIRIFSPVSAQWYLLCMAIWYLIIPYCAKIKPVPMLIISIIFGLLIGTDSGAGSFLAMSRCIVFFPFFLSGYYFDGKKLSHIKPWMKYSGALALLATLLIVYCFPDFFSLHSSVLYAESAYASVISGLTERFIWYITASILVIAFICAVPDNDFFFTYIGQHTLAVYILHRPLRSVFRRVGFYSYVSSDVLTLSACIVVSLLLTYLLSEHHITNLFRKVFTYDYKHILKNKA